LSLFKKIFFWNYARNTWQWDVLCVVILVFIFLTPKSWFASSERHQTAEHQRPTSTVLLSAEVVENEEDRTKIEQRVRTLTGRADVEVIGVRKVSDQQGKVRGYEVDIR
jgi:hypothetical protein